MTSVMLLSYVLHDMMLRRRCRRYFVAVVSMLLPGGYYVDATVLVQCPLQACHAVWKLTCASTHLCYANVTLQVRWQRVLHGLVHCLVGGGFPGVLAAESQLNCSI